VIVVTMITIESDRCHDDHFDRRSDVPRPYLAAYGRERAGGAGIGDFRSGL
jgi:hypothetical protein